MSEAELEAMRLQTRARIARGLVESRRIGGMVERPLWRLASYLFRVGAAAHLFLGSVVLVRLLIEAVFGSFLGDTMSQPDRQTLMAVSGFSAGWAACCWLIADRIAKGLPPEVPHGK